jgi:hypothetical protein
MEVKFTIFVSNSKHIFIKIISLIYLNLRLIFKLPLFIFAVLTVTSQLNAQSKILQRTSPEIPEEYTQNIKNEYRRIINLNGEWNFSSSDPYNNTKVQVPFSYDFKGMAVCSRSFNAGLENPDAWNYLLYCDGINYQCEISINGKFIDKHEGGLTPFSALILEGIIKDYGNTIEIKIDNALDYSKTLPLKNVTNYPKNYGGIYRDIYIAAVPKVFIRSTSLNSEIDINFNADITNKISITSTDISVFTGLEEDKGFSVVTEILDSAGEIKASSQAKDIVISPNSTIETQNTLTLNNPRYWSPDDPYLYRARVIIYLGSDAVDMFTCDFGVYELSVKSNSIIFNRSELKLNGINYIEEFPGSGISGSYKEVEYDVKNIKSLGCNIIKIYGRAASPYLINLCNRYGLLIFEELPVFNVPEGILELENFTALAENQLSDMILKHKNNPSIAAFGLGNDFDVSSQAAKNYVTRLYSLAKKLDKRLIYYSTRNFENDICREITDIVGINFYDRNLKLLKDISENVKIKKQRIFIASYGKIINPGDFSGYSAPNAVEAQSKYIVDFQKIVKGSAVSGSFFLSYADWNSDFPNLKFFDRDNQYFRTSGLYTINREPRPPAEILKKEFLGEDIPNLNIGTYSLEAPIIFVLIGLFTFILFIYLANSVRRFRENVWRAFFRPFIFYTDVREQNLIPPIQNILLALILSIGNALFFANLFYYWRDSQLFDIMLSLIISNDSLKIFTDRLIISPFKLTLVLTAVSFVKIFLFSVLIWLFSLTSKFKIGFGNIYTVTVWGFLPSIILLMAGTFYIRVLYVNYDFVVIGLILAAIIYIISVYRIFKGTYIIFDTFFLKVYAYGIIMITVICGGTWIYLNSTKYVYDYLKLVLSFLNN